MSIATKRGDTGQTGLAGGIRTSKADLRVETYGTVDELNTFLGFARSLCTDPAIKARTETVQRTLFRVGSALATPPESAKKPPILTPEDVNTLLLWIGEFETSATPATLTGAHPQSAAYEVARTLCHRAERNTVRFAEHGGIFQPTILPYLDALATLLALFVRLLEQAEEAA